MSMFILTRNFAEFKSLNVCKFFFAKLCLQKFLDSIFSLVVLTKIPKDGTKSTLKIFSRPGPSSISFIRKYGQ